MKKSELDKKLEEFKEENINYYSLVDFYYAIGKYKNYLINQSVPEWKNDLKNRQLRKLSSYEDERLGIWY